MLSDHYCVLVKPFYLHKMHRYHHFSGEAPRFSTIGDGVQQQQLPEIVIELTLQAGIIPRMHCGTPSSEMF